MSSQATRPTYVYIGTYTGAGPNGKGRAEGIYVYTLDPSTGALTYSDVVTGVANPSFVALDPQRRWLYAVNEVSESDGQSSGAVSAYAIDSATGGLTYLNRQSSGGLGPCHVMVDRSGRFVLVANYGSGAIAMLPIGDNGELSPASDGHQHAGSSVNPDRQQGPHAHSITPDPANQFALVADLGLDQVLVYRLNLEGGKLPPNEPAYVTATPGAGPRHLAFHPNGRFVYVINELDSTMTAYAWDDTDGTLDPIGTASTLPDDFSGTNSCADVHVAPSGRFVYGSNRGHDSIAIFAIDQSTGAITPAGHASTGGETPRNFAITPDGGFLLAANQDSDTIVTLRIDVETGQLTETGIVAQVPSAVCIRIAADGA